jgi:hypothetical protein
MVSKDWHGGLPFTILFNEKGDIVYFREGKVKVPILRGHLEKLLPTPAVTESAIVDFSRPPAPVRSTEEGKADAEKDIAAGTLQIKRFGLTSPIHAQKLAEFKKKYNVEIVENGCLLINVTPDYFKAYNDAMLAEIRKRFGAKVLAKILGS